MEDTDMKLVILIVGAKETEQINFLSYPALNLAIRTMQIELQENKLNVLNSLFVQLMHTNCIKLLNY
jgi:hypothetical protein